MSTYPFSDDIVEKVNISAILKAIGVKSVVTVDPMDHKTAVAAAKKAADIEGVTAIIYKSPCIAVSKPNIGYTVSHETCIDCKKCINDLGCPAIIINDGKVTIEPSLCYGCSLCEQVCPTGAIAKVSSNTKTGKGGETDA